MRPIGDRLVIATHNAGKMREIARAAGAVRHRLRRRRASSGSPSRKRLATPSSTMPI